MYTEFKKKQQHILFLDREITTDTDNDRQNISINKTVLNNNDLSVYSTSVASGASIETIKSSSENLSSSVKSKPLSWADLFRSNQTLTIINFPQHQSDIVEKVPRDSPRQNGRINATNNFYSKMNYRVYNSNGEDSKSLEGLNNCRYDFIFFF